MGGFQFAYIGWHKFPKTLARQWRHHNSRLLFLIDIDKSSRARDCVEARGRPGSATFWLSNNRPQHG